MKGAKVVDEGAIATLTKLPETGLLRLLVAGEVILDRYVSGNVERISAEAPIPVLRVRKREDRLGNAGFVMAGLRMMGATPSALSVVGADRNGDLLRDMLSSSGIVTNSLVADPSRSTIVKERLLGSVQSANRATQQLLRVDEEDVQPPSLATEAVLLESLSNELKSVDGVLISDINKGLLTERLLRALIDGGRRRNIPVIIDPRLSDDFDIYRDATTLTPNRYETERATGMRLTDRHAWYAAAGSLIAKLNLQACLITLDREGMFLLERGGEGIHIPTTPREVYDVTGAGDVVLTVFGYYVAARVDFAIAAHLANIAAGIEVAHLGTELVSREDVARALLPEQDAFGRKILSDTELTASLDRDRRAGRRIAFTNGYFDLLHAGHLRMLTFARAQGDLLVVGIHSDRSVLELTGPDRPIYHAADRARLLAALEIVDYVVIFDETDVERVVRIVRPDTLVKGNDYGGQHVYGQDVVEGYGGRIVLAPIQHDSNHRSLAG
jgi:D-beta-D-heptose 7-phosphate kinase/D-beta-D-heptose 1-phosphate adenosyltransferase